MYKKNYPKIKKLIALSILLTIIGGFVLLPQKTCNAQPDPLHQEALQYALDILTQAQTEGGTQGAAAILGMITSGEPNEIISGAIQAYLVSIGVPPLVAQTLVPLILNYIQGSGSIGKVKMGYQKINIPEFKPYIWEVGIPLLVKQGESIPFKKGISPVIKVLIKWAFLLAGVLAFAMIVYAGFQYLTSGSNTAQQKDAQQRIVSAIIGIILLFAFWIILNTINPDILNTSL